MTAALVPDSGGVTPEIQTLPPVRLTVLRPVERPEAILAQQNETREFIKALLKPGRDYGTIPGTDRPTLLQPGAERTNKAFGCVEQFEIVEQEVDHFRPIPWAKTKKQYEGTGRGRKYKGETTVTGESFGLYRYVVRCRILHRETGSVVGECIGSCSSLESKYVDRPRDAENTILKMAQKRAMVGATLIAFGLHDEFTQDVDEWTPDQRKAWLNKDGEDEGAYATPAPKCPVCQGAMYDNRDKNLERVASGQRPMPAFKCKSATCTDPATGQPPVIWRAPDEPQGGQTEGATQSEKAEPQDEGPITLDTRFRWLPEGHANYGMVIRDIPLGLVSWALDQPVARFGARGTELHRVLMDVLRSRAATSPEASKLLSHFTEADTDPAPASA